MTIIAVPYHLDEYLPDLDLPLEPDEVVTAQFPPGDPWERLAVLYDAVAGAVAADAGFGGCPIVMSGDCNTSAGIMAGLQRAGADPAIVWFDAHGDVQTLETTSSGYLGGLALRLLTAYRPELITARLGLRPVPEDRIVLAGARDLDPPEMAYLAGAQITRREVSRPERGRPAGRPALRARGHGRDRRGRAARPALPGTRRTRRRPARGRAARVAGHRPGGRVRPFLLLVPRPRFCPARRGPAGPDPGVTALEEPPRLPARLGRVRADQAQGGGAGGPLASRPDRSHSSRCAATRQNAPAAPVMADSASGGPNRHTCSPSGAVSSHRTEAAGSPARLSAYGSVRCASQAMCRSRSVSGKSAPSGPAISSPCAQCSASRVVASVAGLSVPTIHGTGWSGSAARIAASAACRARCHRANTSAGAARSIRTAASARASIVSPATAPSPARRVPWIAVAAAASSDWARCSTTSAIVQPSAAEADLHCASSRPLRIFSSRSCSAPRSSKMLIPALSHTVLPAGRTTPGPRISVTRPGHPPPHPQLRSAGLRCWPRVRTGNPSVSSGPRQSVAFMIAKDI